MRKKEQVTITMPAELLKIANDLADKHDRSRSWIIWKAFEEWLQWKEEKRNDNR